MPNNLITTSIVAEAAVKILDNELGMGSRVYRGHESDFSKKVNGYEPGETISVRKPAQFTVREGAVSTAQDVAEGNVSISVDTQIGVDFKFTSRELTMKITDLAERVIKPAMVPLANRIDQALHTLALRNFWNAVGVPGTSLSTYPKFLAGVQRLNETAVPMDDRHAALNPADHIALLGNQASLQIDSTANSAYRQGELGGLAGLSPFMTQNAPVLLTGTRTNGTVDGAGQAVTYSGAQMAKWGQNLNVTGIGSSATARAGEVFTIAGVFAVNPVTKQQLPFLQQFVVTADVTAAPTTGAATLAIQPAIITSGAFQTVSAAPAAGAVVTWLGAASGTFAQNLMFHKNALSLVVVPMVKPPGAVECSRKTYKGLSVRVVPFYDGTNDVSQWRLDVLFGTAAIDPRLGARVSG